jgi:hypothetical protein
VPRDGLREAEDRGLLSQPGKRKRQLRERVRDEVVDRHTGRRSMDAGQIAVDTMCEIVPGS